MPRTGDADRAYRELIGSFPSIPPDQGKFNAHLGYALYRSKPASDVSLMQMDAPQRKK